MNKYIINTDLSQKEVFKVISSCEFSEATGLKFLEIDNIKYVIAFARIEIDGISVLNYNITINPEQKIIKTDYDFQEVAEILQNKGFLKMGRNKLFEYLRKFEILTPKNMPVAGLNEYFIVKDSVINGYSNKQTFVTNKGIDFIIETFKKNNIIL